MKISIIGSGYVGLTTGTCFAELGNEVICMDHDKEKIEKLKKGLMPLYEPGLEALVSRNAAEKRLSFTIDMEEAIKGTEIIFICVGTPPKENGEPDLSAVEKVTKEIASSMQEYKLIVEKSTVPVQTGVWLKKIMKSYIREIDFDIAVNPEFLREGSAIEDFMHPDRIVIGTENARADSLLSELYKPLNAPILHTDINSAELIKHLSNAMLAQRISTINLASQLCEKTNADIKIVASGVGLDSRIGKEFLEAGIGYGGFCLPKDLDAFISILKKYKIDAKLFEAVREINEEQRKNFVIKTEKVLGGLEGKIEGKKIGILGLAFKPNTDDIRLAPSIEIIKELRKKGAEIKVYDPRAMENTKKIFEQEIKYCKDPYDVAKESDALLILTEWQEFKSLDLEKIKKILKRSIILDGRNIYNPKRMKEAGFTYIGVGR